MCNTKQHSRTHTMSQYANYTFASDNYDTTRIPVGVAFILGCLARTGVPLSGRTVVLSSYSLRGNHRVLTLTPNLQYVITPGGTGNIDDALILGLLSYITY